MVWELLLCYNIPSRVKELEYLVDNIEKERWNVKLNMIDEQVAGIILYAEKKHRKLRMGEVEFSLEVSKVAKIWYT